MRSIDNCRWLARDKLQARRPLYIAQTLAQRGFIPRAFRLTRGAQGLQGGQGQGGVLDLMQAQQGNFQVAVRPLGGEHMECLALFTLLHWLIAITERRQAPGLDLFLRAITLCRSNPYEPRLPLLSDPRD